jgi:hypothetical protein
LIDFETGFAESDVVGTVATPTNSVTFSLSAATDVIIAEIGSPRVAFGPNDTPNPSPTGSFFAASPSGTPSDYYLAFANPISALSLSVYDFGGDGGSSIGDQVTLALYADAARTMLLASDSFTVAGSLPDGNAVALAAVSAEPVIAAAVLFATSSPDTGNGIDDLNFLTIPEPQAAILLLCGCAGILARVTARPKPRRRR